MISWVALALLSASPDAALSQLFPRRALIEADARALPWVRVELNDEVLRQCQADLSDLRVLDAKLEPVAFRLFRAAPSPRPPEVVAARVVSVQLDRAPAHDAVPSRVVERFVLELPPLPPQATQWHLKLTSELSELVTEASVDRVGDKNQVLQHLGDFPLFRVPSAAAERLELALPAGESGGLVRVELSTLGSRHVEPRFDWEARLEPEPLAPQRFEPRAKVEPPTPGRTVLTLERPSGLVPERLVLTTTSPAFARHLQVFDVAVNGTRTLVGEGTVVRLAGVRGAERVDVPLRAAKGEQLQVVIDDGDSPALAQLSAAYLSPRPALLFALTSEQSAGATWLYFGGGRALSPRYDVSELNPNDTWESGPPDPAVLDQSQANPAFVSTPPLAAFLRPGAEVEIAQFSHRRAVQLTQGGEGLWQVPLQLDDAALLRPDFQDVRVLDASGHQWPFVLREHTEERRLALKLTRREGTSSVYALELPASPAWLTRVELEPTSYFFARGAHLEAETEQHQKVTLATVSLRNDPTGRSGDNELRVLGPRSHNPARLRSAELVVEDGPEGPLENLTVRLEFKSPELLVLAGPGAYTLVEGSPTERRPRYDVDDVSGLVFALRPVVVAPGALEANPAFQATAAFFRKENAPRFFMWGALGLAVVVLGAMALRLARDEGAGPSA
jgi:hypothetical protein